MSVCGICCNERAREINNELLAGRMIRQVAKKFELSVQALGRHRRRHLRFRSKAQPATTLDEKFRVLSEDAERLQLAAECGGANVREALQVLRLRMSLLELEGKVAGRLSDGSTTSVTVNTGNTPPQTPPPSPEEMAQMARDYLQSYENERQLFPGEIIDAKPTE
jgi:hypothetical protein